MKFKKNLMIARDIGRLFGESNHTVNKWLYNIGLRERDGKYPTRLAKEEGFCTEVWADGYANTAWVAEKVVPILVEAGHPLVADLPSDLVSPIPLHGPFSAKGKSIVNVDGDQIAFLNDPTNAAFTCRVLNAAFRTGTIDRVLNGRQEQSRSPII